MRIITPKFVQIAKILLVAFVIGWSILSSSGLQTVKKGISLFCLRQGNQKMVTNMKNKNGGKYIDLFNSFSVICVIQRIPFSETIFLYHYLSLRILNPTKVVEYIRGNIVVTTKTTQRMSSIVKINFRMNIIIKIIFCHSFCGHCCWHVLVDPLNSLFQVYKP